MSAPQRLFLRLIAPLALFSATTAAMANAPAPPGYREPPKEPVMVVQPTNENVARLSIPKNLVGSVKPAEKAEAEDTSILTSGRTIIAGVAMSAAVMLSGLYLVRRRAGGSFVPVLFIAAGFGCVIVATAFGDALVPGEPPRPLRGRRGPGAPQPEAPDPPGQHRPVDPPGTIKVPLVVEWKDEGKEVKLSIPPEMLHQGGPPVAPKPNAAGGAPDAK